MIKFEFALAFAIVCVFITWVAMRSTVYSARMRAKIAETQVQIRNEAIEKYTPVAKNFFNACRLIAIHRQDRMNVFTFARGDDVFMIETVGTLSDDPDEWRRLAGLQQ